MSELNTTVEVIEALGGLRSVAALTGRKPGAAWNWKKSPTFPSDTYVVMQDEIARMGHSAPPSLWGMVAPDLQPRSEPQVHPERVDP